jgi:protocatechuate 4,5-dioxygenase alpha chain
VVDNEEFDDIPGTTVFTAQRSHQGFQLNQFCMSLMNPENRERFKANESRYLDDWSVTPDQRDGVLRRDYNALISCGGNIYFLAKIFATDGISFQSAAASMTDMSEEEYAAMMLHGGRSPDGMRSIKDGS